MHPRVLYGLRDAGRLMEVSRGLYRLANLPALGNLDRAAIAALVPGRAICLMSEKQQFLT